jgi:TRAP-type C4-dicarboxylate transport system permease small subunit
MDRMMTATRRFTRWGLWFGGALILAAAVLIGIDVLLRKFLVRSIGGADELAGYALAIGTSWSLGAALVDRAHIRIDSLYLWFPRRLRLGLDLIAVALLVAYFAIIGFYGFSVAEESWVSGSRSQSALQIPTVVPQALWLAGLLAFFLVGLLLMLSVIAMLLRGDSQGVARAIGTRSAEEEVEDEIRELKLRQEL